MESTQVITVITCPICEYPHYKERSLWLHYQTQHKNESIKCKTCYLSFKRIKTFLNHQNEVHPELKGLKPNEKSVQKSSENESIGCEICGIRFENKNDLSKQMQIKHNNIDVTCDYPSCNETFDTEKALKAHKKRVHKVKVYICEHCGKVFGSSGGHYLHIQNAHENIRFQCEHCNEWYTSKRGLKDHVQRIHFKKRFECETCGKSVSNVSMLALHKRVEHHGERFHCQLCDLVCKYPTHLKEHMKQKHSHSKQEFKCEICGQLLATSRTFRKHVKRVHKTTVEQLKSLDVNNVPKFYHEKLNERK